MSARVWNALYNKIDSNTSTAVFKDILKLDNIAISSLLYVWILANSSFTMDDNRNLALIASEAHKVAIPEVVVPNNAHTRVPEIFPILIIISSIYVSCNNEIEA